MSSKSHPRNTARREFLKQSAAVSALGSGAPFALNLAAVGSAAAQTVPNDYKALVCVFLTGANDHYNTLVPYDTASFNTYSNLRGGLALDRSTLLPLSPAVALAGGRQFAMAPALAPMKTLFDSGKLAAVLNAGTLIEPLTKAEFTNRSKRIPPKLGSHNDQQSVWQSSSPEGANSGWGGRMGDIFAAANEYQTFTAVSISGNTVFLSGNTIAQYQITPNGSVKLRPNVQPVFGSTAVSNVLKELMIEQRTHLFEGEHTRITKRAIEADAQLSSALASAPALKTVFPQTGLGEELQMVARMLSVRQSLGAKRQVFFVQFGSFDHHSALIDRHGPMLTELADAMKAFYDATVELNVQNNVTAFTASDFGRTLTNNGDGSDHGWGSFHFVAGGAVKGQRYYGAAPEIGNNVADDYGQGRLIPTISVDQYAGTLGAWYGISAADMATVLPNLSNFSTKNLGFL